MSKKSEFLKTVHIFKDLTSEENRVILESLHTHELQKGQTLFLQGDPGGELFVVETGSVGVSVALSDGKDLEIASFSRGDFFGEMSIFEKEPRSATCYAKNRCRLLSLHEKELHGLLERSPAGVVKIMKRMLEVTRRRLQNTGDFLSDMVQWGEEARKRAVTDPLTGLYNRRYLDEVLDNYIMRSKSSRKPMSLVMLDLDHFREINEEYSQAVGDQVIQAVTECFRRYLRSDDVAARYGGDEFTFILPDTDARTACKVMESIRQDVESLDLLAKMKESAHRVTTSQGIACFPTHAQNLEALRDLADKALYRAKELGRNRIVLACTGT